MKPLPRLNGAHYPTVGINQLDRNAQKVIAQVHALACSPQRRMPNGRARLVAQ